MSALSRLLGAPAFIGVHLALIGVIWTGVSGVDLALCFSLWAIRMFGVTAGYHRYFSHRTFQTSRLGQLLLAILAQTSSQRGVLWWAAHHRVHHRWSDTERDVHSPGRRGLYHAHVGWLFNGEHDETRVSKVRDLARFPELRWLDTYWYVPPIALGVLVGLLFGWSGLIVGMFGSTVLLWHTTFMINSLAHVIGHRRFETTDESRNHFGLALLTLGEGWHNNHHHYMNSCRQGFRWWEIDVTYYILRGLAVFGLVWGIKEPPPEVVAGGGPIRRRRASQLEAPSP